MKPSRLIIRKAKYTDDMQFPGMVYMAIVRSLYAHARIARIDTATAKQVPGVVAIFTGADLNGLAGDEQQQASLISTL